MKKLNIRKLLIAVLWIIGLSGLLASLAFVGKEEKSVVAGSLTVNILNQEENSFIDEQDVKEFFDQRRDSILKAQAGNIRVNDLEKALNSHPAIENAEVAMDINGDVTMNVTQRTPVVRVFTSAGESYYIDKQSKLMPLNDAYTARVLIATGAINEPYARRYHMPVEDIMKNEALSKVSVLDDIYKLSTFIAADSVLTTLIHQIHVTKEQEIELYPSIGDHTIVLGEVKDLNEKFNKLKLFYTEGLNKTDGWNKYSTINIKYKNQVVCTKK